MLLEQILEHVTLLIPLAGQSPGYLEAETLVIFGPRKLATQVGSFKRSLVEQPEWYLKTTRFFYMTASDEVTELHTPEFSIERFHWWAQPHTNGSASLPA